MTLLKLIDSPRAKSCQLSLAETLRSKGRENLPRQLLCLARGRIREQPSEGMGGKEEAVKGPCSPVGVTYTIFTCSHLVPVAFDPVPRFSLLDSQRKGLNWDVFQRQVD